MYVATYVRSDYNGQPSAKIHTKLEMADQFREHSTIKEIQAYHKTSYHNGMKKMDIRKNPSMLVHYLQ